MALFKVAGGTVYDPANGVDGEGRDLWIDDKKIVAAPADPSAAAERVLDARGLIVMPGGVDVHAHIAGPAVNLARRVQRAGGPVPTTVATGSLYAGLGYTTVIDAAVPPLLARHAHQEFADTPIIDRGFLALLGNNHYVLQQAAAGDAERLRAFVAWLVGAAGAFGVKVVNAGGVEVWKEGGRLTGLDVPAGAFGATARQILLGLSGAVDDLGLPHALHVHCNGLGRPGNWETTLATMQALEGRRAHLAHVQFQSYGGDPNDPGSMTSRVPELAAYVNAHPELSVDVGQVLFGDGDALTADAPAAEYLHRLTGRPWHCADVESETGCGVLPVSYRDRSLVNGVQWAAGLEWFLLVEDPWQVALSTDHPNGASFLAYPEIIHLLMDCEYRRGMLARLPARVRKRTCLAELDREYSLGEIAIITRAAPARMLGLSAKGHLGPGADADITLYSPGADVGTMFARPRYVIKSGQVIVEDGQLRRTPAGRTFHVAPNFDEGRLADIRSWFESAYSVRFGNYAVQGEQVEGLHQVRCAPE